MFSTLAQGVVLFAGLFDYVYGHTTQICAQVDGSTVNFWAGTYHSYSENGYAITGGVILSDGPSGNGRYDFTARQGSVDTTGYTCSICSNYNGNSWVSWQSVSISGLSDGTYGVTTTSDDVIETPWPGCAFPDITIEGIMTPSPTPPTLSPTPPTYAPTDPTENPTSAPTSAPTFVTPCLNNPCQCNSEFEGFEDEFCSICHSNGCDECQTIEGYPGTYWKLDYNYPCVHCQDTFGDECLQCQDFNGCAQCNEQNNYYRTYDEQEDLYYCVYVAPTPKPTTLPPSRSPTVTTQCNDGIVACSSPNCAGQGENPNCSLQESWGCTSCNSGYFMKGHQYPCVSCGTITGCDACNDWSGCTNCEEGYSLYWDTECGINRCQ